MAKVKKSSQRKKSSSQTTAKSKKTLSHSWPLKKNIFFRPERSSYIRREKKSSECVFCAAVTKVESFETLCVYKSEFSFVVLNKYPYNSGHLLVLPRRHCGDLLKLTSDEYNDLHQTLKLALKAQKEVYQPAATNVGMNHGEAAGAGLPDHLHYHLVPRWMGDLNFFPLIAETKVVIESLEQTYQRYFEYFKSLKG